MLRRTVRRLGVRDGRHGGVQGDVDHGGGVFYSLSLMRLEVTRTPDGSVCVTQTSATVPPSHQSQQLGSSFNFSSS